jgi:hypothetical protein
MSDLAEFGVKYPAWTPKPQASPGMVVHEYVELSMYSFEEQRPYSDAKSDEERHAAARLLPLATVTFYELQEGEPFFDID